MKQLTRTTAFFALLTLCLSAVSGSALAQASHDWLIGSWEGTLNAGGGSLAIIYHLTEEADGTLSGSMDVPAQHTEGIPLTGIEVDGPSVSWQFQVPGGGRFSGRQAAFGSEIDGTFTQAGQSLNLDLRKRAPAMQASEFVSSYLEAISGRDEEALRRMVADSERFMWIEDGQVRYTSVDEILEGLKSLGTEAQIETTLSEALEQSIGSDGTVYTAAFETSVASAGGSFSFSGRMSLFLERTTDSYVLIGGHVSSAPRE